MLMIKTEPAAEMHAQSTGDTTQAKKKRATLDAEKAREIYASRPIGTGGVQCYGFYSSSSSLGSMYGVSPKAVRDIWNRRTWGHATRELWTSEERKLHQCKSTLKPNRTITYSKKLEAMNTTRRKELNYNDVLMEFDRRAQVVSPSSSSSDTDSSLSIDKESSDILPKGLKPVTLNKICDWTVPNLHPIFESAPSIDKYAPYSTHGAWIDGGHNFSTMLNDDHDFSSKTPVANSRWRVPSAPSNLHSSSCHSSEVYRNLNSTTSLSVPISIPHAGRRPSVASNASTPAVTPRYACTSIDERMISFFKSEAFEPMPSGESDLFLDPFQEDMAHFSRQISMCTGKQSFLLQVQKNSV